MIRKVILLVSVVLSSATAAAPQDNPAGSILLPPLMSEEREIALAKSAGLPAWADKATIYVLRRGGYVKAQEGSNGFHCLVSRERPDTLEPQCLDPEGSATILPRLLREAQLREQGKTRPEIEKDRAERFRNGEYRAPQRPGINYMLSQENRVFNGERVIWFPPHLMFYAPYVTSAEVGATPQLLPRSPMVLYEGSPHAYIIVVVPDAMPAANAEQAQAQSHKH